MYSESKNLALLKCLVAIAWADRELCNEELNYLKQLALKFKLTDESWRKLESYLDDPISQEEGEELIRDFLVHIKTPGEKQELLCALEEMIQADQKVTPQEQEFLKRFSQIIHDTSTLSLIRGKLKNLLSKTLFRPSSGKAHELSDYIHNKLLNRLQRRVTEAGLELKLSLEQLNYLTLFGGLLARVAYADGNISLQEKKQIKLLLNRLAGFRPEELELIVAVIEDQALKGLDRFRLTSEFFKVSNREQKIQLLNCLFGLAAANDPQLLHQEVEEIRSIAYALSLSHRDFIDAKLKCLHKNETT
jgi:uncharacterized tellurite resistance protein B-like protein